MSKLTVKIDYIKLAQWAETIRVNAHKETVVIMYIEKIKRELDAAAQKRGARV